MLLIVMCLESKWETMIFKHYNDGEEGIAFIFKYKYAALNMILYQSIFYIITISPVQWSERIILEICFQCYNVAVFRETQAEMKCAAKICASTTHSHTSKS